MENLSLMPAVTRLFIVYEDECVEWDMTRKKTE